MCLKHCGFGHSDLTTVPQLYCFNPNLPIGLVGKVQSGLSPQGKEGRVEKKLLAARLVGSGFEPETYRMLGKSPQLHARVVV